MRTWYRNQPLEIRVAIIAGLIGGFFLIVVALIELIPQFIDQSGNHEQIQVNIVQSGSPVPDQITSIPTPPRWPKKIDDPGAAVAPDSFITFDLEWESILAARRLLPYSSEPTTTIPIVEFEQLPVTFVQEASSKPYYDGPPLAFDVIAVPDNDEWVRLDNKVLIRIVDILPLPSEPPQVSAFERGGGGFLTDNMTEFRSGDLLIQGDLFETPRFTSFDYYTLEPGELGRFAIVLNLNQTPPGIYTIEIGMRYTYGGNEYVSFSEPVGGIAVIKDTATEYRLCGNDETNIYCSVQ